MPSTEPRHCYRRMEEDTDYRIRFSSLCFFNDHVGFHGTIKSSPSDFIVIEIDEQGQLVNKTIDEPIFKISEIQLEPNNFPKKPKLDLQNLSLEDGRNQEVHTLIKYTDGDQNHQSGSEKEDTIVDGTSKCEEKADVLSSFLDEKTHELLNNFACDVREKWLSKTELIGLPPEFSIGRILDKNQRASLHSAIRQKFPFLVTVGKNSEIVVKPNLEYKELCHLVSEEEAFDFFKYLDAKKENSKFTFKPDTNKDHRKAVHHFVNKKFGNLVETKSFSKMNCSAGNPNVVVTVRFREKAHKRGKRPLSECQEGKVIYTAFTLRKENLEMFEAIGFLAIKLGVIPSDFSYAGLKDKKAITYQAMVVRKVTPERLKNIEKEIEKKRMNVFNIRSVDDSLRLGQLKGNHFDIVIRNLKKQINDSANLRERIMEAIENVKKKGFVNYYGPQRFGKGRKVHTDQIGLALLKNEMIHLVTEEEGSANMYAIHQVVLPVLGYNIQYPKNKVGQWYHDILSRDGLQTCRFKVPTLKLNIPGCYRQILKHPCNLSYQLMEDHDIDVKTKGSHIDETALSLLISFDLDASCYATVCLKEIMKHDV
ncbi:pseudouridylate synthase PUS7L isoform X4 [Homo sapiens]|uniref:pseudouridylate synthase PUS7L isoform X4 n=1 Tax=Homo sapiens TaxID=9606 RepID=UPI0003EB04EC|nr:pseudouridylate synthase PUS7L isoform X4 [Homo sapiens]|eukprot:XP_006719686.1 pseudouridylate synthase 7 homolog-like protein isoform X5 [Homo sapiens]